MANICKHCGGNTMCMEGIFVGYPGFFRIIAEVFNKSCQVCLRAAGVEEKTEEYQRVICSVCKGVGKTAL